MSEIEFNPIEESDIKLSVVELKRSISFCIYNS